MAKFKVAYNETTTMYEVHADGCRHLAMNQRLEVMTTVEGDTGAEAAAGYEGANEGCLTKLGPCAKKVTAIIVYPAAASALVEPSGREVWDPTGPTPWVKVGEEILDATTPEAAADMVFCRWNNGSGQESEAFQAAGRRSFSVGDMVILPDMETTLRCARFGFDVVDAPLAEAIADEGDDIMDIDYGYR